MDREKVLLQSHNVLTMKELEAYLPVQLERRVNVLLVSEPGCGKTTLVKDVAKSMDMDVLFFFFSLMDPTDIRGMLVKHNDDVVKYQLSDEMLPLITADKPIVVCLDDFFHGGKLALNAGMQLTHERRINSVVISPYVRFVGCTNRMQDAAGVSGVHSALQDRFRIIQVKKDKESTALWGLRHNYPDVWISHILNTDFVERTYVPPKGIEHQSCTPRGMSNAAETMLDPRFPKGLWLQEFAACAGSEYAGSLIAYITMAEKCPPVSAIMNDPHNTQIPDGVECRWATCIALVQHVGKNPKTYQDAIIYIKRMGDLYEIPAIRFTHISAIANGTQNELAGIPAFTKSVSEHYRVLGDMVNAEMRRG